MITEIVNYMKHLEETMPDVLRDGVKPANGLHVFVELDKNGKAVNFPGEKGSGWGYYTGKNTSKFFEYVAQFDVNSKYINMNKQQKFDKKQKIHSASPFALAFNFNFNDEDKAKFKIPKLKKREELDTTAKKLIKTKRFEVIKERLSEYYKAIDAEFSVAEDKLKTVNHFRVFLEDLLTNVSSEIDPYFSESNENKFYSALADLKETEYLKIYLKNISVEDYELTYAPYLRKNIFNKEQYNKVVEDISYGVLDDFTTFQDKKLFLTHRTSPFAMGISRRFLAEDALRFHRFVSLQGGKANVFPSPLPIFIDKSEFSNANEILSVIKKDERRMSYSEILKKLFKENSKRVLENYYLLFFQGQNIVDLDYVSKFRFSLEEGGENPIIQNIFGAGKVEARKFVLDSDKEIQNIFHFEAEVVVKIFNGFVVNISKKGMYANYFGELKPDAKGNDGDSMGDLLYVLILKYRKAFYDYIYKSQIQAINHVMWDEILWASILRDMRNDKILDNGKTHSEEKVIIEKLNIWFSLYNYFCPKNSEIVKERKDMAKEAVRLEKRVKEIAEEQDEEFANVAEYMFACGQLVRRILEKNESHSRTHALLEPFTQKNESRVLNEAIAMTYSQYKHAFKFYRGKKRFSFETLLSKVMQYGTSEGLKKYLPELLAGYFAPSVFNKNDDDILEEKEDNEGK